MTDQPSSTSQPSMEDILASIRRIIDDEDVKPSAPASAVSPAPNPQSSEVSFGVDDEAAALALAEYDAAIAADSPVGGEVDSAGDPIFPQRDGLLWRRVAGHPLSEGETDPLDADDTLELTDALDDELELSEVLDSGPESDHDADEKLLDEVVAAATPAEPTDSSIGIGAMTAAGIGAAGASAGSMMDRITGMTGRSKRDDTPADEDDDILDLTRTVDTHDAIDSLASGADEPPRVENDHLPPPVFERVDLDSAVDETQLDQSFEKVAVTGLQGDYSAALSGASDDGDERERALDDRFYKADDLDDLPPELDTAYTDSFVGEPTRTRDEGAPTEDEMETVGGLVRDALRGRLPAVPDNAAAENALVTGGAEESAARSLAALARYDAHAPRRIYGGIKITDDEGSPTIEGMVQETLRPMLRDWLNDNLPTLVENMVKQEVDRISARSRRFVRDDED